MSAAVLSILAVSVVAQLTAAVLALRQLKQAGRFKLAWVCVAIALLLMVERRLLPLRQVWRGGEADLNNAMLGLAISLLMLAGVAGLKQLFAHLHAQESALTELANTDELTRLHNRRHFMQLVEHELKRAQRYGKPFSLLMLDIDFFKTVNDSRGHAAGDRVLQGIAEVCRDSVRQVDIAGRLGGEEFAVFLPETGLAQALEAAERLRLRIGDSSTTIEGGPPVRVTVSLGVASVTPAAAPEDSPPGLLLHQLLEHADQALYAAKAAGRNCVRVHDAAAR